jgi:biopolymer transport protein ExbD
MKNDGTVWFNILSKNLSDTGIHRVLPPVTTNLKKAIADYEKSNADIIKRYLIKGDNDVSYKTFEQVIEALKQNNIFKYNLLTSQ